MPNRRLAQLALTFICTALLFPLSAKAKTDTWYRVELIVFSHPAGSAAEQWDATPNLAYSENSRLLTDKASAPTVAPQPQQALPTAAVQPVPFVILSPDQRELRNKAAAIERSDRYQVLFHEAWDQQMGDRADTLPIVLDRSGDGGAWPKLQGTIKLYVARYLYLETNLWLNTQGEYLHSSWRMHAPPLGPASLILDAPERPEAETVTTEPALNFDPQLASIILMEPAESEEELEPIYPFRHAVLLNQTRRMRSGEVHYIDHPMLGVIVKITPLPDPESQTKAQAESE